MGIDFPKTKHTLLKIVSNFEIRAPYFLCRTNIPRTRFSAQVGLRDGARDESIMKVGTTIVFQF